MVNSNVIYKSNLKKGHLYKLMNEHKPGNLNESLDISSTNILKLPAAKHNHKELFTTHAHIQTQEYNLQKSQENPLKGDQSRNELQHYRSRSQIHNSTSTQRGINPIYLQIRDHKIAQKLNNIQVMKNFQSKGDILKGTAFGQESKTTLNEILNDSGRKNFRLSINLASKMNLNLLNNQNTNTHASDRKITDQTTLTTPKNTYYFTTRLNQSQEPRENNHNASQLTQTFDQQNRESKSIFGPYVKLQQDIKQKRQDMILQSFIPPINSSLKRNLQKLEKINEKYQQIDIGVQMNESRQKLKKSMLLEQSYQFKRRNNKQQNNIYSTNDEARYVSHQKHNQNYDFNL
ncbi:UNKNOWN [Stylonychia lemnae]|uniref:Uncharacterized protein n=1 Tax=Stylonychia lemnae TaxID=5949 RepID=A0A078APW0_STYLE|nr:UNKNOWN [Stylonychia lemnae]|eukprot:CDW83332.1 UNKNOWN [Stylonychia lemnae]